MPTTCWGFKIEHQVGHIALSARCHRTACMINDDTKIPNERNKDQFPSSACILKAPSFSVTCKG